MSWIGDVEGRVASVREANSHVRCIRRRTENGHDRVHLDRVVQGGFLSRKWIVD